MPKKHLTRSSEFPYHVSVRSNDREWFYLPMPKVWEVFSGTLTMVSAAYAAKVHSFVLMSNHLHMLVTTPDKNIDEIMRYFLRESCRSINRTAGRINHLFGAPYHWSLIRNAYHYGIVYKYDFQNPVEANLCKQVEDYPFSTLYYLVKGQNPPFPLSCSRYHFKLPFGTNMPAQLDWLNKKYAENEKECIQRGLRRCEFAIRPDRNTRKIPPFLALDPF